MGRWRVFGRKGRFRVQPRISSPPGWFSRSLLRLSSGPVEAELPKIIRGERVIEVDKHADHSAYLLPNVTDRLIAEVLA